LISAVFFPPKQQATGGRFRPALTVDTGDRNVNTGSNAPIK